jgi:hypothetical protein
MTWYGCNSSVLKIELGLGLIENLTALNYKWSAKYDKKRS